MVKYKSLKPQLCEQYRVNHRRVSVILSEKLMSDKLSPSKAENAAFFVEEEISRLESLSIIT